jgi:hypothetical protein
MGGGPMCRQYEVACRPSGGGLLGFVDVFRKHDYIMLETANGE